MKKGKATCRALKDIRLEIARENEIDYTPPECTHEGDCSGTCPQCESEVQYLERQLARRQTAGKAISLTGLAIATASMAALSSCGTPNGYLERNNPTDPDNNPSNIKSNVINVEERDATVEYNSTVMINGEFYVLGRIAIAGTGVDKARVRAEGGNETVVADETGNFKIMVKEGKSIIVSHPNWNKDLKFKVRPEKEICIVRTDDTEEEPVLVGIVPYYNEIDTVPPKAQ